MRRLAETKRVLETNDSQVVRGAALKHLGILMQLTYIIHEDVVAGRLVPVLTEWGLQRVTINIAYPTRRHLPAKVRCFVDFLVEQFVVNDFERRSTAQGRSRPQGNGQRVLAQRLDLPHRGLTASRNEWPLQTGRSRSCSSVRKATSGQGAATRSYCYRVASRASRRDDAPAVRRTLLAFPPGPSRSGRSRVEWLKLPCVTDSRRMAWMTVFRQAAKPQPLSLEPRKAP